MNLEDYVIGICFDKSGEVYWSVTKKGKLHYCNKEELKMVSEVLNLLRKRIDNFTGELKEVDIINMGEMGENMRKININNPEELKRFKLETSGFVSSYGFPYRLDDVTEKGANYTVFCPLRWKSAFSPAKLHKLLKEDVDADKIHVEYIDFVKEEVEDKKDKIWKIDYD